MFMTKTPKLFSLSEVNALIPELEKILSRLMDKKVAHERLHDVHFMEELLQEATKLSQAASAPGLEDGAKEVDGSILDLEKEIEKLRSMGCLLRSLEAGWVEFPAEQQGRMIYFCWRKGESAVRYYRPTTGKSTERIPL